MQVDEKALAAAVDAAEAHHEKPLREWEVTAIRAAITAYLAALGEQKPVAATYVAGISPETRTALNAIDDNLRQAAIASSTTFVGAIISLTNPLGSDAET